MTSQLPPIFALASGAGRGAIAVIRVSGHGTGDILAALAGRLPPPRTASLRRLRDQGGATLDRALILWMPGPASFTGEDCAELHIHGGPAVLRAIFARLLNLGARPAEAGEFSRRAFLNSRLDLTEAEGIADLIDAESDAQRRQALRQMEGSLKSLYGDWAERLRRMLAWQEATIDFVDEELPAHLEAEILATIAALESEFRAHLDDNRRGERLREGLLFVVAGPPNAGKSSLINALSERDVAIVSAIPGTTRDAIEVPLQFGGLPVTLVDTAGIHDTNDEIEREGVRRARSLLDRADLLIRLHAPGMDMAEFPTTTRPSIDVASKADLAPPPPDMLAISTRTGDGLDQLRAILAEQAAALVPQSDSPALSRARHRAALDEAANHLASARAADYPDLRAEDLRLALAALGRITGAIGVEDLLDTIFSSFCIGK